MSQRYKQVDAAVNAVANVGGINEVQAFEIVMAIMEGKVPGVRMAREEMKKKLHTIAAELLVLGEVG